MLDRDVSPGVTAMFDGWVRQARQPAANPTDPIAAAHVGRVPSVLDEVFVRIVMDEQNGNGTVH
jgi:hypothetical protein